MLLILRGRKRYMTTTFSMVTSSSNSDLTCDDNLLTTLMIKQNVTNSSNKLVYDQVRHTVNGS